MFQICAWVSTQSLGIISENTIGITFIVGS